MSYSRHRLFLWALLCRMGSGGAHQPLKSPAAVSWSAPIRGLQPKKWHFRGKFDPQNSDIMGIYIGIYTIMVHQGHSNCPHMSETRF